MESHELEQTSLYPFVSSAVGSCGLGKWAFFFQMHRVPCVMGAEADDTVIDR